MRGDELRDDSGRRKTPGTVGPATPVGVTEVQEPRWRRWVGVPAVLEALDA